MTNENKGINEEGRRKSFGREGRKLKLSQVKCSMEIYT
jgi:hypothetical protein